MPGNIFDTTGAVGGVKLCGAVDNYDFERGLPPIMIARLPAADQTSDANLWTTWFNLILFGYCSQLGTLSWPGEPSFTNTASFLAEGMWLTAAFGVSSAPIDRQ